MPLGFVGGIYNLLKVGHRFHGVSIVYLKTANIQDDQGIEHLEYIGRGLVDDHKNHFATKGQLFQQVHNVFRVAGRQP